MKKNTYYRIGECIGRSIEWVFYDESMDVLNASTSKCKADLYTQESLGKVIASLISYQEMCGCSIHRFVIEPVYSIT